MVTVPQAADVYLSEQAVKHKYGHGESVGCKYAMIGHRDTSTDWKQMVCDTVNTRLRHVEHGYENALAKLAFDETQHLGK